MSIDFNELQLVAFDEEAFKKSKQWLKDPEIRHLTHTPDFTDEQQLEWFRSLPERKNYLIRAICAGNEIVGVSGLKNISPEKKEAEYFGYIGNKAFWGKGIGNWLMDKTIEIAKEKEFKMIYLRVIPENIKALNLYFKKGFKIFGFDSISYYMERTI